MTKLIAHTSQSYEGAARLLGFRGGQPLPWSAMVLARTAFESALRAIYLMEPLISDEVRLARIAAHIFEGLNESAKANDELPEVLARQSRDSVASYRQRHERLCAELGLTCVGNRRGRVDAGSSGFASFPLNLSDVARRWWNSHGVFTYRWLSSFTHGTPRINQASDIPVAALDAKDVFATFATVTEAVWFAMDGYARWLGFPDNIVMALMRRVKKTCGVYFPGGLPRRPPGNGEDYFVAAAQTIRELGLPERVVRNFLRGFTRTIDD